MCERERGLNTHKANSLHFLFRGLEFRVDLGCLAEIHVKITVTLWLLCVLIDFTDILKVDCVFDCPKLLKYLCSIAITAFEVGHPCVDLVGWNFIGGADCSLSGIMLVIGRVTPVDGELNGSIPKEVIAVAVFCAPGHLHNHATQSKVNKEGENDMRQPRGQIYIDTRLTHSA